MSNEIELSPAQMGLGNNPLPESALKPRAFTGKLIPRSDWQSTDWMLQFVPRGKCQFSQPSCNSYATGKTYQTKYALTIGKAGFVRPVSYSALHQEITGGNMNEGSMPLDAIRINQEKGLFAVENMLPEWYERNRDLGPFANNRKLQRADEWEECPSGAYVASAILALQPCNIGIWWRNTWKVFIPSVYAKNLNCQHKRGRNGETYEILVGCRREESVSCFDW